MYITQEADYAVRIVYTLAKAGQRRDARSISEEAAVTLRFSLKILGKLGGAGIVKSFKGNRGGYELARPPEEITLQDVLSAVEGPFAVSRCIHEGNCSKGDICDCVFHSAFREISDSVNSQMAGLNFAAALEEDARRRAVKR